MDIETLKKNMAFTKGIILQIEGSDLFTFADKLVKDTASKVEQRLKAENKPDELLSRKQAGKMLQVDLSTLYRWEQNGILKPVRIGKKVLYCNSDIKKKLQQGK